MDFSLPDSQDKLEHKKINYNPNNFFQRKYLILLALSILLLAANSALYFFILKDTPFYIYILGSLLAAVLITFFSHKLSNENEETSQPALPIHVIDPNPESKQQLEEILHAINEGVILTDLTGKIILISRKSLEILRSSMTAISGKSVQELLPHEASDETADGFKIELTSMTGEPILVNAKTSPYFDLKKKLLGKIYLVSDITKELTFEEMKLDFVSIAAHQLRTPLTAVKGYLYFLDQAIKADPNKLAEKEKEYLNRCIVSSDRLSSLIENLLNVSRIEGGKMKLQLKQLNLNDLLKKVANDFSEKAREKKVTITIENQVNNIIFINGDPNLLEAAFSNIIDNAINYNKEGGWINISINQHPDELAVHISDSGRGIPSKSIPLLFTKFFRVSNSLTQLSNGIGLGLYITKSILDAHNAKVEVNSLEGRGTTVSISLPLSTQAPS